MSKEVDAFIVLSQARWIQRQAPPYLEDDIATGLSFIHEKATVWADGKPITADDASNLYSAYAFLRLGELGARQLMHDRRGVDETKNPYVSVVLSVFEEVLPCLETEALEALTIFSPWADGPVVDVNTLGDRLIQRITSNNISAEELRYKYMIMQEVRRRRGKIVMMVYDIDGLINGLGAQDLSEIAPDMVKFDGDLSVASQSHNIDGLIDRAGIEAKPMEVQYFETFSEKNATEMLADALMDIREVGLAIKTS